MYWMTGWGHCGQTVFTKAPSKEVALRKICGFWSGEEDLQGGSMQSCLGDAGFDCSVEEYYQSIERITKERYDKARRVAIWQAGMTGGAISLELGETFSIGARDSSVMDPVWVKSGVFRGGNPYHGSISRADALNIYLGRLEGIEYSEKEE